MTEYSGQFPPTPEDLALAAAEQAEFAAGADPETQVRLTRVERKDRLGSDAALIRLREIRDNATAYNQIANPSNAQVAARVKEAAVDLRDVAKWLIEASKILGERETDGVEA